MKQIVEEDRLLLYAGDSIESSLIFFVKAQGRLRDDVLPWIVRPLPL